MTSKPLVSILMNCYNGEKFLREAIESIQAQTYHNWELIFWDNQSTDQSAEIFKSYVDRRLKYFYAQKHTELGDARVEAMSKAKGSWVGILDVDDIWCKEKLEYQVDIINKSLDDGVELGLVYGKVLEINERGIEVGEIAHSYYKNKMDCNNSYCERENPIPHEAHMDNSNNSCYNNQNHNACYDNVLIFSNNNNHHQSFHNSYL